MIWGMPWLQGSGTDLNPMLIQGIFCLKWHVTLTVCDDLCNGPSTSCNAHKQANCAKSL